MAIGWLNNVAEADTYFTNRFGARDDWAVMAAEVKTALLTTSYNRIYHDPQWSIPATPTAVQLVKLKMAQEELAWYMYVHMEAEDRRKGVQVQGVTQAGIVKETYDKARADTVPYPPIVTQLLNGFETGLMIGASNIGRDEDESVQTEVYSW